MLLEAFLAYSEEFHFLGDSRLQFPRLDTIVFRAALTRSSSILLGHLSRICDY